MGFKPNFEINFKPSVSPFQNDTQSGLTHTAAGLSTEFIILGEEGKDLEARIAPYGEGEFLPFLGLRQGKLIRGKVREQIRQAVKDKFGSTSGKSCEELDATIGEILDFKANPPDRIGRRSIKGQGREIIAKEEAQVQLENFEAALNSRCLKEQGDQELEASEEALAVTQADLVRAQDAPLKGMTAGFDNTNLMIIGGAIILGSVVFFAIK